ncbi:2-keto-4-pentenoate hydratase [Steroidobacter cummioxidans]|uniref:2-keto-4-pentenoate hydratase n=1 Tax=Steroidobacter cummioxidans TaxID=1803913 RepID=UPI00137B9326|nr:fumarylacetoacetate hydrolase family protein [Steroidobacter cummioxidans]
MQADQVRAVVDQFETHVRNRTRFQLYRFDGRPATLDEAYAIQDEILARALRSGSDSVAGYKIGLTTEKMQKFCGVGEPIAGRILKSTVHASGATLRKSEFHRLGIESELALRLGKEVPAWRPQANVRDLIECVDAIAAAFEIIDDRDADYAHLEASSIAAENSWNRGVVLGEATSAAAFGDLRSLQGQLLVNGEPVATGSSNDVMNGPLWVLAWVARFAQAAGQPLRPGQWIMTGSIIPTRFAVAGDTYSFQLGPLPAVNVAII